MKKIFTLSINKSNFKKALALFLVCFFQLSFSQTGWQWGRSGTTAGTETASSIATDPAGNSYVTGTFNTTTYSVGTFVLNNTQTVGSTDVFILKYDAAGNLLWAKNYGGAGGNRFEYEPAITLDGAGNFYLSGYTDCASIAFGTTTLTSFGSFGAYNTYFLVKFDSNGNPLWSKGANGFAFNVAANATGAWVTGWFTNPGMSVGTTTFTGAGFFVAHYDTNGNPLWANKATSSSGVPGGTEITVDALNNCIVGGDYTKTLTIGTATVPNTGTTNTDFFVAKYDATGNFLWVKGLGGGGSNDNIKGLATDGSGNVLVNGNFTGTITVGTTTLISNSLNTIIAKFDLNGNGLWAIKPTPGTGGGYIEADCIRTDNVGNVYASGFFTAKNMTFGSITKTNAQAAGGTADMYVVMVDPSGAPLSLYTLGGLYDEEPMSISLDAAASVYVSGYFTSSTVTIGPSTLSHTGNSDYDIVVARLNMTSTTGVNEFQKSDAAIIVYPNPASDAVYVEGKDLASSTIELYNITGQLVYQQKMAADKTLLHLDDFESGLYILKVNSSTNSSTSKLVIRK